MLNIFTWKAKPFYVHVPTFYIFFYLYNNNYQCEYDNREPILHASAVFIVVYVLFRDKIFQTRV